MTYWSTSCDLTLVWDCSNEDLRVLSSVFSSSLVCFKDKLTSSKWRIISSFCCSCLNSSSLLKESSTLLLCCEQIVIKYHVMFINLPLCFQLFHAINKTNIIHHTNTIYINTYFSLFGTRRWLLKNHMIITWQSQDNYLKWILGKSFLEIPKNTSLLFYFFRFISSLNSTFIQPFRILFYCWWGSNMSTFNRLLGVVFQLYW